MPEVSKTNTVVFLGCYDRGKPRVKLLIDGATAVGIVVHECHADIWNDIDDKAQARSIIRIVRYIFRWILSRPVLLVSYLRAPPHRAVVVPYPGLLDALFFYPAIKLRGAKLYLDAFISIYDTVINDRKLVNKKSVVAKLLYCIEWMATRAADATFLDTESHSNYFSALYGFPTHSPKYVPVGVDVAFFPRKDYLPWDRKTPLRVLFYGQFIPLQGTMTLLEAINIWERLPQFPIRWTIIGRGQDSVEFDRKLTALKLGSVRRIDWISYQLLSKWIEDSDVCCGIFGNSQKALNVVPNKVYQVLAVGRPILTADTPGIRSLVEPTPAIELIQPNDANAIVLGLSRLGTRLVENPEEVKNSVASMPIVGPRHVGEQLQNVLQLSSCN